MSDVPKRIIRIGSDEYPCFIDISAGFRYLDAGNDEDEVYIDIEAYKPVYKVSLVDGEKKYETVAHKREVDQMYATSLSALREWAASLSELADEIEEYFSKADERRAERKAQRKDPDTYSIDELLSDGDE